MAVKKEELVGKLMAYPPNTLVAARVTGYGAGMLSDPILCLDTELETILNVNGSFGIMIEYSGGAGTPAVTPMTVERLLSTLETVPANATIGIVVSIFPSMFNDLVNTSATPCVTVNPVPHPGERDQICLRW